MGSPTAISYFSPIKKGYGEEWNYLYRVFKLMSPENIKT